MPRLIPFAALLVCIGLLVGHRAEAGFPWRRQQAPPSHPQAVYAPQVRNYAVVAPTPVAGKHGVYGSSMLWAEQRPATPVYPWGWFGTHNSPQGWSHTGYYGNYRDLGLLREQ